MNSDVEPISDTEELEEIRYSSSSPWELYPSDIGSQLTFLGLLPPHIGIDEKTYDMYSLSGCLIDAVIDEAPVGT